MKLPIVEARCCRIWQVPAFIGWGRCGYCNEKPIFVRALPEEEWVDDGYDKRQDPAAR